MTTSSRGGRPQYEFASRPLSLLEARLDFMQAIRRAAPNVFESLHDEPLIKYQATKLHRVYPRSVRAHFWKICCAPTFQSPRKQDRYLDGLPEKREDIREMAKNPSFSYLNERDEHIQQVVHEFFPLFKLSFSPEHRDYYLNEIHPKFMAWLDSLEHWAQSWNLNVGWVLHWAFLKLDSYADRENTPHDDPTFKCFYLPDVFGDQIQPQIKEKPSFASYGIDGLEYRTFEFWFSGWRPFLYEEEKYRKQIKRGFEAALDQYIQDCKTWMERRPDMAKAEKQRASKCFDWLAMFQCGDGKIYNLAKQSGSDRRTIRQSNEELAEFIGIKLRPSNPPGTH